MATKPVIDYTDKDFASLRRAMLDLAAYRLPEWTDQSPNDLGVLLVDLFAYMGDIVLYYQDRIASESFLHTAVERRSVLHLLRLIGYELKPPVAASADLTLFFEPPGTGGPTAVTVPGGATFTARVEGRQESFQYVGQALSIDLTSAQVQAAPDGRRAYRGLPVRHSREITEETIGSSTGEPNQTFHLADGPLLPESLVVEVNEGAGWLRWERWETLLYHHDPIGRVLIAGPEARVYHIQFDETGTAWVVFGDGEYGRRPTPGLNNVRASYRIGGGAAGNDPAGAISEAEDDIPLLDAVSNPLPSAGGTEAESTDHAVRFGPLAFRSGRRAVTLADFVALAQQAGGVAKVRARRAGFNTVELVVAPEADTCRPVPDELKKRLIAYVEDKRMAGTIVRIRDSVCVPVDVEIEAEALRYRDPESVRREIEAAVRALLDFHRVDFGQPVYLSKVYEAVESLEGVFAATVTVFRRRDRFEDTVAAVLASFKAATVEDLPEVVRRTVLAGVAPEGRLDVGEFEIAALGTLAVRVREEGG